MSNFIFENTWEENQEALKTKKLAIIPVGSTEQHGPALPVGTDWIVAEYLAKKVGEKTDKGLVAPVIPYGHALYHRATILTEALPYIQRYNGKIVVVNCGGVAMDQELRDAVATDITLLRLVGVKVVLVHGIGPEVRQALKEAGKELPVVDGFPQVNENAIDLVQETLCGKVNKTLVATLNKLGAKAIGLCGIDGGFLTAKSAGGDYPCTGELVQVDGSLLEDFLSKGYTPVVATIAQGAEDPTQVYSVSANHTAAKLAVALKAEKLIHLVAAEQLLHTPESPDAPIPVLPLSQVPALIRNGTIPADMAGKVNFSVEAVRSGVKSATLLDGSVPHAILLELLSDEGIGTMLTH